MTFALGISDFSAGEGIYPAELLLALAERLGYGHLAAWDMGLHGFPKLRDELAWRMENRREAAVLATGGATASGPPGLLVGSLDAPPLRLMIGSRFTCWRMRPK